MAFYQYSHEERIRKFQDTVHQMTDESYWSQLRLHGRVDKLAEFQFKVVKATGQVVMRPSQMTDQDLSWVGPHVRRFVADREPTNLGEVLKSLTELEMQGDDFEEAQSQWRQVRERRFPLIVAEDRSVGVRLTEEPEGLVWWDKTDRPPLSACVTRDVSLLDCLDVYYNEELLHAFERNRNEAQRAVVRSLPKVLRRSMAKLGAGSVVYTATILHARISAMGLEWQCSAHCPEQEILRRLGS